MNPLFGGILRGWAPGEPYHHHDTRWEEEEARDMAVQARADELAEERWGSAAELSKILNDLDDLPTCQVLVTAYRLREQGVLDGRAAIDAISAVLKRIDEYVCDRARDDAEEEVQ